MSLAPGTLLGAYRIISLLGEGGMGQVYRARDEKLGRDVALKILPDAFTNDPDRLTRFEREAHLLASLNHPNIAAIYGVEDAGSTRALVLELVEGPTLQERLEAHGLGPGGLAVNEAVAIARQIADALQAAHEQGIIHRDLKPANVKVRDDGTVKVLDLGLAKGVESAGPVNTAIGLSQSPTITSPAMTQVGMLLGTAAYMAPEQAKGRSADKRSDVWAFGCVLYEMLAGKRPFAGDDISDTLASVLKEEPDWTALPSTVPPAIRTLVQRCLVKDRHRRVADIAAAQFVLAEYAGLTRPERDPAADGPGGSRARVLPVAAAVLLTAIIVGAGAWTLQPGSAPPLPLVRFAFRVQGAPFTAAGRQAVAISPDGTQIVYVAGGRLHRRSIGELDSREVPGTDVGPAQPVFSPDGQAIAFFAGADSTIKRVSLAGGVPVFVASTAGLNGMSWGESGIVFVAAEVGILRVSPRGGEPELIVRFEDPASGFGPQLLPGGTSVLFTLNGSASRSMAAWDAAQTVVQSLTSGDRTVVIENASDARYLSSGHLVYAKSGTLFAVGFDAATLATTGPAVPVLAGVRRGLGATTQFAVSETGALVYVPGPVDATSALLNLVLFHRTGVAEPVKLAAAGYTHPRVSPDGGRLAVGIENGRQADVWIYDFSGTSAIRRLTLEGQNRYPIWSADGQRVAFHSDREGNPGIFWQPADGGTAERLTSAPTGAAHVPESLSPDGKHLLFSEVKDQAHVLFSLSLSDRSSAPFGSVQSTQPIDAVFSPDGRWITYAASKVAGGAPSPDRGVFIQPFPATGVRFQAPKAGLDFHPMWARNGRELFYAASVARPLVAVGVQTQPRVTFTSPLNLPDVVRTPLVSTQTRGYDVLPDGRFLGMVSSSGTVGAESDPEIRVVLNWTDELKRLVP